MTLEEALEACEPCGKDGAWRWAHHRDCDYVAHQRPGAESQVEWCGRRELVTVTGHRFTSYYRVPVSLDEAPQTGWRPRPARKAGE